MFKKITVIISLFIVLNSFVILFESFKFPIYQIKESLELGGEYVYGDTVRVEEILPDSPASKSGIQKGDILLSINGASVNNTADFVKEVEKGGGNNVEVEILRNNTNLDINITPSFSKEYNRYLTGVVITTGELEKIPFYRLIPLILVNTYSGKYDLLPSMKSGLVSLIGHFYGLFFLITGIGIYKMKKWGLYLLLLLGLSYIFTFISFPSVLLSEGLGFFTNLNNLIPYGLSIVFVISSVYFLLNRKQFGK